MDRVDALGGQYQGSSVLAKQLLAETDDAELQKIVESAAAELKSPMALVSLILDQIQFFKAHVGLPDILVSSRGTHREVSFCQFVVRDGKTFEVNDGPNDLRIPQHVVKEFNIHSYLGVPIKVGDIVVGSLCVLDTKKRGFTAEDRIRLNQLAELVNKRLEAITKSRRQARLDLTYTSLQPALTELTATLRPIHEHLNVGYSYIASIKSFLDISQHLFSNNTPHSATARMSQEAAIEAVEQIRGHYQEIEMSVLDGIDCLNAINNLVTGLSKAQLSEVVTSAQDLVRNATKPIGGFPLPDFGSDPVIHTKSNLAIALVSNCLLMIATALNKLKIRTGIRLKISEYEGGVELIFVAKGLEQNAFDRVADQLNLLIGTTHPTILVSTPGEGIILTFKTISPR